MAEEFIPPKAVVGGRWYYGGDCPKCGKQIVVSEDLSKGQGPGEPRGIGHCVRRLLDGLVRSRGCRLVGGGAHEPIAVSKTEVH